MRNPRSSPPDSPPNAESSSAYSAPALEKGLDILEALAEEADGLTLTSLAVQLGRTPSELYRMLVCLARRGYVARNETTDRHSLTLRLFELAHRHPPMRRLVGAAMPIMQSLASTLNQSCHLSCFLEGRQLVIAQADAPGSMGFGVRLGANTIDLLMSASGRALLAFQEPARQGWMLNAYRAAGGVADLPSLHAVLDDVTTTGLAEMDSFQVAGVRAISRPVMEPFGNAIASLTIPFLVRLDEPRQAGLDDARHALRQAADQLSLAMGGCPPPTSQ